MFENQESKSHAQGVLFETEAPTDQTQNAWTRGLGQLFERVVFFQVTDTHAKVVALKGVSRNALGETHSLLAPGPLRWAVEAAGPVVGSGKATDADAVTQTLGIQKPRAFAVMPLVVNKRLIALAYADNGKKTLSIKGVGELFEYCATLLIPQQRAPHSALRAKIRSSTRHRTPGYIRAPGLVRIVRSDDDISTPLARSPFCFPETLVAKPEPEIEDGLAEVVKAPESFAQPKQRSFHDPIVIDDNASTVHLADDLNADLDAEVAPDLPEDLTDEFPCLQLSPNFNADQGIVPKIDTDEVCQYFQTKLKTNFSRLDIRGLWFSWLSAAALLALLISFSPTHRNNGQLTFDLPPNTTTQEAAEKLYDAGIIRSSTSFRWLARLTGLDRRLQAGVYLLPGGAWSFEVLSNLHRGVVEMVEVTIAEGLSMVQVAQLLGQKGLTDPKEFITASRSPDLLKKHEIEAPSVEGFLFPETYKIARGISPNALIEIMLGQSLKHLEHLADGQEFTAKQMLQWVTLASIIEREAADSVEYRRIAGVFKNRLLRQMRLESCATVQYILGKPKSRLLNSDLRTPSPYNTYLHEGLPPGPISNPGLGALRAALDPEPHSYLFFVAREDGSRRHVFNENYSQHLAAQKKIRKRL
jgi:UPF0755 protein